MSGPNLTGSVDNGSFTSAPGFWAAIVQVLPALRRHARRLVRNDADVDDLVQETLLRAWRARDHFVAGTNLQAWVKRIARNHFLSELRRFRPSIELDETNPAHVPQQPADQDSGILIDDISTAFEALSDDHRAALLHISLNEGDYQSAAFRLNLNIGTLKSRVARARVALANTLQKEAIEDNERISALADTPEVSTSMVANLNEGSLYKKWKRSGSFVIG